ncbi:MAG: DegQ family serine endoprotease [Candidatus Tectimicrobiota bacterium]
MAVVHTHRQRRPRGPWPGLVPLWLLLLILALPVWTQAQTPGIPPAARELANAFTDVARRALPAVVYITVEKSVETQDRSPWNNPLDWFNEEFFERFFRGRLPEGQQQPREFRQQGQGSGFLITPDGVILTNNHVVSNASRVTVRLADGREFAARTLGTDPPSDVAVVKIEGTQLPVLALGTSGAMEVGDWVIAAGSPFGLTQSITVGVVSAKGRSRLGIVDFEDFLQTDAAINPGNSGGPLINLQGEAIGLNTAIFSRSGGYMGIGFAIPIDMVKTVKDQLITGGKVVRGSLGVRIQELTSSLAESLQLQTTDGVLVADVLPRSPAAKAGLKRGDVIVALNGHPMHDPGQLRNTISMSAPGTRVTVQVLRDNKRRDIPVELGELPREQTAQAEEESQTPARLGFNVQSLTPDIARQLGYDTTEGVVVQQVDPRSEAYQAGVRTGMVILQINRQEVTNINEFRQAVSQAEAARRVLLLVQTPQATRYITFPVG